eukprot:gene15621-biopygen9730
MTHGIREFRRFCTKSWWMDPGGGLQCGATGCFLPIKEHRQVEGEWGEKQVEMRRSADEASGGEWRGNGGNVSDPAEGGG